MLKLLTYRNFILLIVLFFATFSTVSAQTISDTEVKAGYIFNFVKFVEWPENKSQQPYKLGILGEDPFGNCIDDLVLIRGEKGEKWEVNRNVSIENLADFHIIFISDVPTTELIQIIEVAQKEAVLTISDNRQNFCELGGLVNFPPQGSEKRLEINYEATKKSHLLISANLLKIAQIINE